MKYLNVGCGKKFSKDNIWENIDMSSNSKYVKEYNLLKGFPYEDGKFDVVYHSQVLEHIPKENASEFLSECFRVLKEGGTLRIVVPDLENIANEYLRLLKENLHNSTEDLKESYNWIMLELYDQTIRNESGGMMKSYLEKDEFVNEEYMNTRMGFIEKQIRNKQNSKENTSQKIRRILDEIGLFNFVLKALKIINERTLNLLLGKKYKIGSFRLAGEIHYWMYDRFSLSLLLKEVGFRDIKIQSPQSSSILNWEKYELDVKEGFAYDPNSLFIEAKKITTHNKN